MIYNKYILPHLVHSACRQKQFEGQRQKIIPLAFGKVLELGAGSGLNLKHYRADRVSDLWALEPSRRIWDLGNAGRHPLSFAVHYLENPAEDIPLDRNSVDTVVVTYSLCTIPDIPAALREVRRVLKSSGRLLFCEHSLSPDPKVQRWQHWLNPPWQLIGGGCHLNRDIPALLSANGFSIGELHTAYLPGWRPASYNCWGSAIPRNNGSRPKEPRKTSDD